MSAIKCIVILYDVIRREFNVCHYQEVGFEDRRIIVNFAKKIIAYLSSKATGAYIVNKSKIYAFFTIFALFCRLENLHSFFLEAAINYRRIALKITIAINLIAYNLIRVEKFILQTQIKPKLANNMPQALDRDYFVLPNNTPICKLNCDDAFNGLTKKERLYAYYLSQASWYGSLICLHQVKLHSIFAWFDRVLNFFSFLDFAGIAAYFRFVTKNIFKR